MLSLGLFWCGLVFLLLVWLLYPLALRLAGAWVRSGGFLPKRTRDFHVSVVIAAHNEQDRIVARLENICACDYPEDKLEIVVVSDGSDDRTVAHARTFAQNSSVAVKVVELRPQQGRARAHNAGVAHCAGEIVVFTDADTVFDRHFLVRIVEPFRDARVGYASGRLVYRNEGTTEITESAGLYWRFEYLLREWETRASVYVFGSGACCAVRKELFRELPPTGDVDFTTPLDVVLQGYRCVHVEDAIAYDEMPADPAREFRARVRMTAKNFHGTITRWGWRGLIQHPIYSLVIFCHKIGRWLTPFAMLGVLLGNLGLLGQNWFYNAAFGLQLAFYGLALLGWLRVPVPFAAQAYSFCLASAGFLMGVVQALFGRVPAAYKPVRQQ